MFCKKLLFSKVNRVQDTEPGQCYPVHVDDPKVSGKGSVCFTLICIAFIALVCTTCLMYDVGISTKMYISNHYSHF